MHLETLAIHAGDSQDVTAGSVAAPIHLTSTFRREADGSYPHGFIYARNSNPNRNALEECLAALEGGAAGAAFSSGQAATMAVFQSLAPGDHVVAPADVYWGTVKMLREIYIPWGLTVSFVDMTDPANVSSAMRERTRLVWVETPSNPLLRITDIAAVASVARAHGARCAVDNTWGTPVLQRPLELGAHLVMHSTTKYFGGHSDVLGGALVASEDDDWFARIRLIQGTAGAVPSPFECWLTLRGIRTLPYRMRAHCENARRVAEFLAAHPAVEAVHYPGLPSHTGHAVAAAQMSDFGGMLSVQVKGGEAAAMRAVGRVQLFTRATSLGGVESLIEHRASVESPETATPRNLLRVSVGLEHPDDLIADLEQALG
jgi:cystathionine gamma-synthase